MARMAHEILERNRGAEDLVIVGIHTGGVHLARRIAANLAEFEGIEVPVATLDVSLYRDDIRSRGPAKMQPTDIPMGIQGKRVVDFGRPQQVQLAILLDRGHRELPIRADFVGQNLPTAIHERVKVRLMETDGADEVALIFEDLPVAGPESPYPAEANEGIDG